MNALLLAAGLGTRLNPITKTTPKCLVKVGQYTMLDHWLYKLDMLGVENFIINTHYLSEKVEQFISKHEFRHKISLYHEETLLGTAGTLAANKAFIDQDTFVVHVDNFCLDDLTGMVDSHLNRPKQSVMTMLTFETNNPKNCGLVTTNENNLMTSFVEKPIEPSSSIANGAVYIISKEFKEYFSKPNAGVFDISIHILPKLLNFVSCYKTMKFFIDVGTPENLELARRQAID
jgi:mannose-1-phosphate guanylyltransferase